MNRASLALTALLAGATAYAQPAPPPNPEADAAYQEARRLYDLREWDASIAKFKEAYRLRPDAPSLFNIAQANRLKGDCVEALSFYKTYKRNFPAEKNIDKVDRFISEMEECAKTQPAKPVDTGPTGTAPTGTAPTGTAPTGTAPTGTAPTGAAGTGTASMTPVAPPADDPGRTKRLVGLGVAGVGVLSLGASVFFGVRAHNAAGDAEGGTPGSTWDPSIESRGESSARNAKITLGVGAALVVAGGVLYVLGRTSSAEEAHVAVVPSSEGATVVWGGGF